MISEGKAHTYEVKEQPVSGYQSKVNGYDITNYKDTGSNRSRRAKIKKKQQKN
ncbi:Cna B-type domain-containing protein [Bacillus pacificus]